MVLLLVLVHLIHHIAWLLHVIELWLLPWEPWVLLSHTAHHTLVEAHLLHWHLSHLVLLVEHHVLLAHVHHVGLWLEPGVHLRLRSEATSHWIILIRHSLPLSLVTLHHYAKVLVHWLILLLEASSVEVHCREVFRLFGLK